MSQLLKGSQENWVIKHLIVVYSGFNTDYGSSEPLKTLVMLCYVICPRPCFHIFPPITLRLVYSLQHYPLKTAHPRALSPTAAYESTLQRHLFINLNLNREPFSKLTAKPPAVYESKPKRKSS